MSDPKYKDEVQVILKAVNQASRPMSCDRYILLTKGDSKIDIGRSTKRDTRLTPGAKNCWFDSPVMSRKHARLVYVPASNTVTVVDLGSLHGTYVNDKLVSKFQFRRLQQDDKIRFGLPIQKGSETFSPCEIKVTINHGTQNPEERPVVFKVPDSSEGEDDASDIDQAIETSISLIQKAGMTLQDATKFTAIDLTGDDDVHVPDVDPDVTVQVGELETHGVEEGEEVENRLPSICWSVESDAAEEDDESFSPQESTTSSIFESDEEDVPESIESAERTYRMDWEDNGAWEPSGSLPETTNANLLKADSTAFDAGLDNILSCAVASEMDCDTLPPLSQTAQPSKVHLPSLFRAISSSSYQPPHTEEEVSADSLGVKSGKPEFFHAREHNRQACLHSEEEKENGYTRNVEQLDRDMESSGPYVAHKNVYNAGLSGNCTTDSATAALWAAGEKFLQTPVDGFDDMQTREEYYLDDTSAYTFEMSKKAAESQEIAQPRGTPGFAPFVGGNDEPAPESSREHLDAAPDAAPQTNKQLCKRKSDAISQLVSGETEPSSSQPVAESQIQYRQGEAVQVESPDLNILDERAPKRLRRVAEVFGYAALGGVAVMSALIATAPSL